MTAQRHPPTCPRCNGLPHEDYYFGTAEFEEYLCERCGKTYRVYQEEVYWEDKP